MPSPSCKPQTQTLVHDLIVLFFYLIPLHSRGQETSSFCSRFEVVCCHPSRYHLVSRHFPCWRFCSIIVYADKLEQRINILQPPCVVVSAWIEEPSRRFCQLLHRTSPICTAVSCSAPSRIVGFCDLDPFTPLHGLCLVYRGNHIWCSPVLSISYPTRLQTPSACLSRVSGLYAPPLLVNSPSCRLIRP